MATAALPRSNPMLTQHLHSVIMFQRLCFRGSRAKRRNHPPGMSIQHFGTSTRFSAKCSVLLRHSTVLHHQADGLGAGAATANPLRLANAGGG